jgi:type II secretory ATPase GspE/PulE/Tfp pilus assembly ATPase PilB-like protein
VKRKAADITARMSRSEVAEAQAKARAAAFVWPAPPYYEFSDPAAAADGADCLLMFRDGAKTSGVLLSFMPEGQVLRFRAADAADSISVAFSSLFGVQLRRPVEIRRPALRPDDTAQLYSPAERQPFAMRLINGNAFRGETVGSVHALCGVFLFPPERDGKVTRWFVPADAAESASIGKPIGEMLVEEKLASPEAVDAALSRQKALRSRRFGQYLTDNQIVSSEQLAAALKRQRSQPIQKLGETLVELGYLTESELDEALAIEARDRRVPLGQILADMGVVEAEVVNAVIARKLGIPYISLRTFRIPPEVLKRIPAAVAQRFQTLPVAEADNALAVAIENPMDMAKLEELRFVVGSKLLPVMASGEDIRSALGKAYGDARAVAPVEVRKRIDVGIGELTHRLAAETADAAIDETQSVEQDNTLVQLVNKMIIDAAEQKASDIHIEANPGGKDMRVRFRKDGALVTYLDLPAKFRKAVVSRLKIMAQLDITERRKPQDGKIEFRRFGPLDVDLRMATIPTTGGLEDIVMRVLTAANPVALDALGFDSTQLQVLKRLISRPHGLFLVCGPTGAGKTTTLHSLLRELNTADLKIWTAEDPIEIVQAGLRQVQVNPKIGWTFAAAMRSFMRADPDVIMVGEMRDAETAKTGIEASLTGHLVFSTLHTNSAVESVVRLLDLGMDPFNFADALLGVLAQRLLRKLCPDCKVAYAPSGAELEELASESRVLPPRHMLYRANGCMRCDRTGYQGRMAVYELLVADAAVKRLMQTRAPVSEIAAAAAASGLRTLKQSALDKVIEGHTDLQQVRTITS